jgi:hypothetical protein
MFTDLIGKRMIPYGIKDKLEILLFEENLFKKINRSFKPFSDDIPTYFENTKEYNYINTHFVNVNDNMNESTKIFLTCFWRFLISKVFSTLHCN